jgi:hypothetical protein
MSSFIRPIAFLSAAVFLASASEAAINLNNVGVTTGIGLNGGVVTTGGGGGLGGGGGFGGSVSDLQSHGYTCAPGHLDEIECRSCSFEPVSETQECSIYLCKSYGTCYSNRTRWNIPRDVDTANGYGMWAAEFSLGASSYWLGDFNNDGKRDLGAQQGPAVQAALSRTTYFEPQPGSWTGPAPVESAGPSAMFDVNHDGIPDVVSVSPEGRLRVGVSSGSGIAATVDLPGTWCEGIGDCLIGDVNGDGLPDLLEVMRGAVSGQRPGDVWVSLGYDVPGFPTLPPAPTQKDTDSDGVSDAADDCIAAANPSQLDSDGDGYGNACDGDLNGDGRVDQADVSLFIPCLGTTVAQQPQCASSDFDGNGGVDFADAQMLQPMIGKPPGPSAAHQTPAIELFTPADGTILPTGSTKAWVAGWVPNVAAGDVELRVGGNVVPVTGPSNYFSTFVDLAPAYPDGTPKLFHDVLVEASRSAGRDVVRRVVLVGDHAAIGQRAHDAFGARLTSAGMARVAEYVRTELVPDVVAKVPGKIDGYHYDSDCEVIGGIIGTPICWNGYSVSNTTLAYPSVTVDLDASAVHIHVWAPSLQFDWSVDGVGWSCGDHATAWDLHMDMRYGLVVGAGGRIEVSELQEPQVTANVDVSGCWGAGHGRIQSGVIDGLTGFLNDPDDVNGSHGSFQTGPIGGAIQDFFRKLDMTGSVTIGGTPDPVVTTSTAAAIPLAAAGPLGGVGRLGDPPLVLAYDTRFEYVTQNADGISAWLGVGIEPTAPKPQLGGPQGAYQLPGATAPALPSALPSGNPFDLAGAVTPNGLNELLDALTRGGLLAKQGFSVSEVPLFGTKVPLTAGLLSIVIPAFSAYPPQEAIVARVTPPAVPPVVSGRSGPNGEPVDVHVPQVLVELVDESGSAAVALRADLRVGVDVGLGSGGSGSLTAFARHLQVLSYAIVANPVGADPQQVFQRILCIGEPANDPYPCALDGVLQNGLDQLIQTVDLPSLADDDPTTPDLGLVAKCMERLADGSLVGTFGLLLPGEAPPPPGPQTSLSLDCMGPLTMGGGTLGGSGTVGGGVGGLTGTVGTVGGGTANPTAVSTPPTAVSGTTGGKVLTGTSTSAPSKTTSTTRTGITGTKPVLSTP